MNSNIINILITAKDNASKVLKGVKNSAAKAVDASKKFAVGLAAAGVAAVAFGAKAVSAFNAQERASVQLATLVKNVKGATDEQVESLKAQASALQKVGVVGDEVTMMGQAQLATFGLQSNSIKNLTPALLDMATQIKGVNVGQEDMQTLGNLVGKVMGGQVGALSRYGVTLSEAQKEQLKSGNEMERSAVLAKVLEQNFGGVNKALRNTFQGRLKAAKNTLGDFMELLGGLITNAIKPAVEWFNNWADSMGGPEGMLDKLKETARAIQPHLPKIGIAILTMLVPAFLSWGAAILSATWPLLILAAAGAVVGIALQKVADSMGGWGNLMAAVKPVLVEVVNTVKDGLVGAFNLLMQVWQFLQPSIMQLWGSLQQLFGALRNLWNFISPVLIPILKVIAIVIGVTIVAAIWLLINYWNILYKAIAFVINFAVAIFKVLFNVVSFVVKAIIAYFKAVWAVWNYVFQWLRAIVNAVWSAIWSKIGGTMRAIGSTVRNTISSIVGWFSSIWGRISGFVGRIGSGMGNAIKSGFEGIKGGVTSAINWVIDKINSFINKVNGIADKVPGAPHIGNIPRLYTGGQVTRGGLAIVGESGPEAVMLPAGANVVSNRNTQAALSNGALGGSNTVNINVNYNGRGQFSQGDAVSMAKQIRDALRAQGLTTDNIAALRG